MEAIVLAGGFGSRLQRVVSDKPKSMADVNGRPFLEYLFQYLTGQGVTRVILSVGYMKDLIMDHFKDHYKNLELVYATENEPLGTGGGIRNAFQMVQGERAYVLNGDSMFRIDLSILFQSHIFKQADVTLALRYMDETGRYGSVVIDEEKRITGFLEKGSDTGQGLINGGIYLLNKSYLAGFPEKFSIEKDCFEKNFLTDKIYGYPFRGFFMDIGIPEDYMKAQNEFKRFDD
ncbi:MAG: nucleotidyltransferase family protein [Syntrophothermus sp.]